MATTDEKKDEKKDAIAVPTTEGTLAPGFDTSEQFELIQRQAKLLASSPLVPKEFQGNIANVVIAMELARRIGCGPLAVMQNLYIIHGKPSWSAQFIIGAINSTNKFSPLRFEVTGEGDKRVCYAWAIDKAGGQRLEGPPASIEMAKAEGWLTKSGSKWKTMPELMLHYRAATFFGRLYAPEILNGMRTADEVTDIVYADPAPEIIQGTDDTAAARVIKEQSAGEAPGPGDPPLMDEI